MVVHLWWMAKCRGCQEWLRLQYGVPQEAGRFTATQEPHGIAVKCPQCGHKDTYSGRDLELRIGPDPNAETQAQ